MPIRFPELGHYMLPGHRLARRRDHRGRRAEELGLGSTWASERFDEGGRRDLRRGRGDDEATSDRHRRDQSSTRATRCCPRASRRLSGACRTDARARRVGRGAAIRAQMMGPAARQEQVAARVRVAHAHAVKGERVSGHDSPLGKFPYLHQADWMNEPIPCCSPRSGSRASSSRARSRRRDPAHVRVGRGGAPRGVTGAARREKAGRDPQSVKVWSVLAVAIPRARSAG